MPTGQECNSPASRPHTEALPPYQLSCAPWWMRRLTVLHPSTSSRIFLRLIILVACCTCWRMGGMMGYPPLNQPGPRYPGLPSPALMGAPGALVAGPVFLRGLAEEEGKQVCSSQRRWAVGPSRTAAKESSKGWGEKRSQRRSDSYLPLPRPYLHAPPDNLVLGGITGSGVWPALQAVATPPLSPVLASLPGPNLSLSCGHLYLSP